MGRRKIKMELVKDKSTKQVTFSKRRLGLFKKASELATLTNAEVGIVIFSLGNKPFSFGKPNFDLIADRYKYESEDSDDSSEEASGSRKRATQEKRVCNNLNLVVEEVKAEKKRGEKAQILLESAGEKKFKKPIETLTLEELKEYEAKMKKMLDKIQNNTLLSLLMHLGQEN